jgi:DNA-binding transcriptional ArsR family regulator
MEARRDVFQAIADPTRRAIINLLSQQTLNLNSVADHFDISRPAVSKHIKILTECGLITIKQEGRERICKADLKSLSQIDKWLDQYRVFWTKKLDALQSFIHEENNINTKKKIQVKKSNQRKK